MPRVRTSWRRTKAAFPTSEGALHHLRDLVSDIRVMGHLDCEETDTHWIFHIQGTRGVVVEEPPAPPPHPSQGMWFLRMTDNTHANPRWHQVGDIRPVLASFVEISTLGCRTVPYSFGKFDMPKLHETVPPSRRSICKACLRYAQKSLITED